MSDTIDATPTHSGRAGVAAAVSAPSPSAPAAVASGLYNLPSISTRDLVRLTHGLYLIFLGLLMTVLVGAQIIATIGSHSVTEIFLGAGVVATLVGTLRLYQVKSLRGVWAVRTRLLLAAAVVMMYGCVTFFAWQRLPSNTYLLANAAAFVLSVVAYIILLSRVLEAVAWGLCRREMAFESKLLTAADVGLLLVPMLGGLGYVVAMTIADASHPLMEFQVLLLRVHPLVLLVLLLPLSLTLSLVWAAKDAALQQLDATIPDTSADDNPDSARA